MPRIYSPQEKYTIERLLAAAFILPGYGYSFRLCSQALRKKNIEMYS